MRELINRLLTNWKSTTIAMMIAVATMLLVGKQITPTEWCAMMGSVATFYGFLKKDNDI